MQPDVTKPALGQKTEAPPQRLMFGGNGFSGGTAPLVGVSETTGVNSVWPWWGTMLWGTYGTYRAMCRFPTIAYVLSQVLGPLLASEWTLDADENAPQEAKDWVTENVIEHRDYIMPHALRAVVFGNAPFEVVWASKAGRYIIPEYVPLLQDNTRVRRANDGKGPFAGLENGEAKLAPAECLYILNNSDLLGAEPGDDYGRSRLENIRDTSWAGALDTLRKLAELEDRVTGVVPVIIVPAGFPENGPKNPDGSPMSFAQLANALLPSLCHPRSQGAVLETPSVGEVDASTDPARLKQLTSTIDTLDMGDRSGSQAQMLEKLKYLDEKMGEGLYRGARTLFATEGGTKADSGQHTANAEPDEEAIDNMIAEQINSQPVRVGLTLNFGPDILRKVRGIKPAPLVDSEKVAAQDLVMQLLANPATSAAAARMIDGDKTFAKANVATLMKWADAMAQAEQEKQQRIAEQQKQMQQPVNGNGNGNVNPRTAKAARTVNRMLRGN
jgi:hypothetical protein